MIKPYIDKMLEIAGHDERYEDVLKMGDDWYIQLTWTAEKQMQFEEWLVMENRRSGLPKWKAEDMARGFVFTYGLKVEDE